MWLALGFMVWLGGQTINPNAGWLGSRVVSVLDSGTEGPGFKSQP